MAGKKATYINPYTDFGFKKLFGEEGSKDLLIDFLNQLLPPHHQIESLDHIPQILNEPIFTKAFTKAELAAMTAEQRETYTFSLMDYLGMKNAIDTAVEERDLEIIENAIKKGYDDATIADLTGISLHRIAAIRSRRDK